jgi:(p)ppGpp synthase/HD superfamily hydrolase
MTRTRVEPYSIMPRQEFIGLLEGKIAPDLIDQIMLAYKLAKYAHKGQERDNGERYFDHPKRVARLLIQEWEIYDHQMIIAALLHDIVEDTFMLDTDDIGVIFGERVSVLVDAVSKRKVRSDWDAHVLNNTDTSDMNDEDFINFVRRHTLSRHETEDGKSLANFPNKIYVEWIESIGGGDAIILKFADRISNMREVIDCDEDKIRRNVKTTTELYLDLLEEGHPYREELEEVLEAVERYLEGKEDIDGNELYL